MKNNTQFENRNAMQSGIMSVKLVRDLRFVKLAVLANQI